MHPPFAPLDFLEILDRFRALRSIIFNLSTSRLINKGPYSDAGLYDLDMNTTHSWDGLFLNRLERIAPQLESLTLEISDHEDDDLDFLGLIATVTSLQYLTKLRYLNMPQRVLKDYEGTAPTASILPSSLQSLIVSHPRQKESLNLNNFPADISNNHRSVLKDLREVAIVPSRF